MIHNSLNFTKQMSSHDEYDFSWRYMNSNKNSGQHNESDRKFFESSREVSKRRLEKNILESIARANKLDKSLHY